MVHWLHLLDFNIPNQYLYDTFVPKSYFSGSLNWMSSPKFKQIANEFGALAKAREQRYQIDMLSQRHPSDVCQVFVWVIHDFYWDRGRENNHAFKENDSLEAANYHLHAIHCLRTCMRTLPLAINTLRPKQDGHHFPDDIFECIFLKENVWIPIKISLKFVPKSPINNIPALVH